MSLETIEQAAKEVMEYNRSLNLGIFIVSFGADALLCGVMIVQMINYWTWSEGDRMFNKAIVMITTMTSFAITLYIVVLMFRLFVVDFGTYAPFISPTSLLLYMSILDLIPAISTQLFFTERAYKLCNRSKILIGAIGLCTLVTIIGAFGLSLSREAVRAGDSQATPKKIFMYLWLCGSLAADLLITSSIMLSLLKSKTGWKETDVIIGKLIKIMVETQLPPTLLIIYFFIVTFGFPRTYLDIFALLLQSKFYTCGLLASLNSRYFLKRALQNESSSHGRTPKNGPVVHVRTDTFIQNADPAVANSNANTYTHRPTYTHTPQRFVTKDPLGLGVDDDSIELEDKSPHRFTRGNSNEGNKLDYIDNASKTGLTDNVV